MYRIRLGCTDHDAPHTPAAPMLAGDLRIGEFSTPIAFLVDTGADHAMISGAAVNIPPSVLKNGGQQFSGGVGGTWPTRYFSDASFGVVAVHETTGEEVVIEIPLPTTSVLVPWVRVTRKDGRVQERLSQPPKDEVTRYAKRYEFRRCHPVPHLMGRDIFVVHRLTLNYDPHNESSLIVHPESGLLAPLLEEEEPSGQA